MELIKIEENGLTYGIDEETENMFVEYEKRIKLLKEQYDKFKQDLLEKMEEKNVLKIDTDRITFTYIAPTDRETFDSKTFKEEHQDLYDEYVKMSPVKSSLRIKVK